MPRARSAQLAYSEQMDVMRDEAGRRRKAAKIIAVLQHFLGRSDLRGLRVADVGSSTGFIADELSRAGGGGPGHTLGFDIDVPGLSSAQRRFGGRVSFICADGSALPVADGTLDVVVFNHIYEHVVDPEAVLRELHRVLARDGVVYLGLGNRLGLVEPHYRLPFLSYLPPAAADRYLRATGRGESYHERFRTRPGLRRMLLEWQVWDYTVAVLREPHRFAGGDVVPGVVPALPEPALRALLPLVPTYIWVATKTPRRPAGPPLRTDVRPVRAPLWPPVRSPGRR